MYKGLQRPLEFMGLQGRYIAWAAISAGTALIGFILAYVIAGFIAALVCCSVALGVGFGLILLKQKRGLSSKQVHNGVYIYAYSKGR